MRFVDRLTTLIKADAHGVVESLEDRRLLARQCIREATLSVESKRGKLQQMHHEQERLVREQRRLQGLVSRADADVTFAVEQGQDELARGAIRKLLPLRENAERIQLRLELLADEEQSLAQRVADQEQQLQALQARLQLELSEVTAASGDGNVGPRFRPSSDDVELELLRRRKIQPGTAGDAQ